MQNLKLDFITGEMFVLLKKLSPDSTAGWGKMNTQQMVEHTATFFYVSVERIKFDLITPEANLPKYREFLYSDKAFRENTKAPSNLIGEEPFPLKFPNLQEAINDLQLSVDHFCSYFEKNPEKKTLHPVFGLLNFDEWVMLHYKHVTHHLRQFGLIT